MRTIVGVVSDVRYHAIGEVQLDIYDPGAAGRPRRPTTSSFGTSGDPRSVLAGVRAAARELDADVDRGRRDDDGRGGRAGGGAVAPDHVDVRAVRGAGVRAGGARALQPGGAGRRAPPARVRHPPGARGVGRDDSAGRAARAPAGGSRAGLALGLAPPSRRAGRCAACSSASPPTTPRTYGAGPGGRAGGRGARGLSAGAPRRPGGRSRRPLLRQG